MRRQPIVLVKWHSSFLLCLLLFLFATFAKAHDQWRILAPGIEYQDLDADLLTPWSHIHAFRINLKDNTLSLVLAKDLGRKHASIDEYAAFSRALLAINGGFFDSQYQPLGLRIHEGQLRNPTKKISWWGIFYLKNQKPYLSNIASFNPTEAEFAVQSGPRLLINKKIPPLKAGRAERSALGITQEGQVIVLVTDNMPMSTTELAQLMQAAPLNCTQALNLDGGSSSQLRAHIHSFQLDVHGFSNVSDAIIVKSRQ